MFRVGVSKTFILSFILAAVIVLPAFGSQETVVARGDDGFVVTEADVRIIRGKLKADFKPSNKALIEGAVRMALFAREASRLKIECPVAEDIKGFDRDIVLANCYMQERLKEMDLAAGAVESFYRANWRRFLDRKTGKLLPLVKVKVGIEQHIRAAKKNSYLRRVFEGLCQKYNVVFTGGAS